ncbi:WAS/WASL-interacting protein family member 3-like [Felis catus]|uniref:WAS/WASL-interacting protein family member 3-like n=1 Tax=Felis catus TaxID=9685 RepID=UPI001D19E314|nr:WAS/WASL-interacting protein family member 3-like [Felis catus]
MGIAQRDAKEMRSSKRRCQVGGVGDRHTTFLGLDTDSETAPELSASERITAVEIFKSCGSCSHTSFSTAPASTFQRLEQNTAGSSGPRIPSVRTQARHEALSPSTPKPPTRPACLPWAERGLAVKVQAVGLGGPAPAPSTPESGIPSLSPSAVRGRRGFVSGSRPSALARPQETRNQKAEEACVGAAGVSEAAGSAGEGGPDGVQTFGNRAAPLGTRPSRREEDAGGRGGGGGGGWNGRPRWPAELGRRCAGPGAKDSAPRPDTHHARGPRGTTRAPAAPTGERGAGRASSRSPPPPPPPPAQIHMGRGSPPRVPPTLSPLLLLLLRLTASRCAPKPGRKCLHSLHPKAAAPEPPPQPPPEVWLKLSRLCREAASCVLPPQPPPPTASPAPCRRGRAPPPSAPRGFPQEEAPARVARRDLLRVLRRPRQPPPTRVGSGRALTPSALDCLPGPGLCRRSRMPNLWLVSLQPWDNSRASFPCLCHSEERSSDNSTGAL